MLLKVENIQEVGRFASLKHKAPHFGRLSLLFARNGYGKSTICSILRSATDNDPQLIAARRRLGSKSDSLIHTEWKSDGAVKFAAGKWNSCPGHVLIFDHDYVLKNLHVAESVTRGNKRSLLEVVVGEKGVALAKKINDLDAEQRDLTTKQSNSERVIKAACRGVTDVEKFASAAIPDDIDAQIVSAEKGLELAKHAMAVKQKKDPPPIELHGIAHYEEIAGRGLDNVSEQAASLVKAHLDHFGLQPNGERWLRYGVDHLKDDTCPFCTQDVSGVSLVSTFKGFFSGKYDELIADRDAAIAELGSLYGENGAALTSLLSDHAADFAFWQAVCDLGKFPSLTVEERGRVDAGITALIEIFRRKTADPLKSLSLGFDQDIAEDALTLLHTYSTDLAKCVAAIQVARTEVSTADVSKAQEILDKRKALKLRLSGNVKTEVETWVKQNKRRAEIAKEKATAQAALKAYVKAEVPARQSKINELLELFGANFHVVDTEASFVGREPNTEFSIAIGNHSVKAGEKRPDEPSFKTMLSAGDKFTLALAFFLSQIDAYPDLSDATIVFDDPFSSQDMQRQWETTSQIRALSRRACQVIVLSHDPRFLQLIEKDAAQGSFSCYQVNCDDEGKGEIRDWSSAEELKDQYVRQAERIREFAGTGTFLKDSNADSLVKDIRPFLENYVRARCPARYDPHVMLGTMVEDIEGVGANDPLFKDVEKLRALNEYTRPYMHGSLSNPGETELRAQCKKVVSVVGSY
jgi:wobble nucleotide-excising tRNase